MRIDSFFEKLTEYSIYVLVAFYSVSKAMIEISFTVALCSWLVSKCLKKESLRASWNLPLVSLFIFVLFSVASIFVSQYPIQSIRGIGKHLEEVFFFLMVLDIFQAEDKMKKLVSLGLIVLYVTLLDGLFQFASGFDFLRGHKASYVDTYVRILGPFKDHTLFSSYIMAWGSIIFTFLFDSTDLGIKEKRFMGFVLFLALFCLFHTQARGGWASFALSMGFFLIIQRRKVLLILFPLVLVATFWLLPRNMIIHPDYFGKEQSMVERHVLWDRAVDVIKARPWLGTGINTYVRSYQQFDREKSWRVQNYYAHNSYLQVAAERGLPALFFFLLFVFSFYWRGFIFLKSSNHLNGKALMKGLMIALFGLLVFALVDTIFEPMQTGMMLWLFFGMGFAVLRFNEKKKGYS